jgi:hypothetical protein
VTHIHREGSKKEETLITGLDTPTPTQEWFNDMVAIRQEKIFLSLCVKTQI